MHILFISSGKNGSISEIVNNQAESLRKAGIIVDYFLISPGIWGYISSIPKILSKYRSDIYDLIHAHYSFSAFAATLAGRFPLVVSLMGSDLYMSSFFRLVSTAFARFRWNAIIVKNPNLKNTLKVTTAHVIPNGVDMTRFKTISMENSRKELNLPMDKKIVLFIAYPNRPEKNLELAKQSIREIGDTNIEFLHVFNIPNESIPLYLNAANVLLLTSQWEGSPNVIKEAMACNCPVVATDVGDIRWIIGNTEGCYITSFDPQEIADKIKLALAFNKRTNGRQRIIELGLDSESVAKKIINVYAEVIGKNTKKKAVNICMQ